MVDGAFPKSAKGWQASPAAPTKARPLMRTERDPLPVPIKKSRQLESDNDGVQQGEQKKIQTMDLHMGLSAQSHTPTVTETNKLCPANKELYAYYRKAVPDWPRELSVTGELLDVPYTTHCRGWPLHFRNPENKSTEISLEDLVHVFEALGKLNKKHPFWQIKEIKIASTGVAQVNFNGKGAGNLQVFVQVGQRAAGNCLLNIGEEHRVKVMRKLILSSEWFEDVQADNGVVKRCMVKQNGNVILPLITVQSSLVEVENMCKAILKHLGMIGKNAMVQYATDAGFADSSKEQLLVQKIFKQRKTAEISPEDL